MFVKEGIWTFSARGEQQQCTALLAPHPAEPTTDQGHRGCPLGHAPTGRKHTLRRHQSIHLLAFRPLQRSEQSQRELTLLIRIQLFTGGHRWLPDGHRETTGYGWCCRQKHGAQAMGQQQAAKTDPQTTTVDGSTIDAAALHHAANPPGPHQLNHHQPPGTKPTGQACER